MLLKQIAVLYIKKVFNDVPLLVKSFHIQGVLPAGFQGDGIDQELKIPQDAELEPANKTERNPFSNF